MDFSLIQKVKNYGQQIGDTLVETAKEKGQ